MGLRAELLRLPLDQRFNYDPNQNIFFANFEGLTVRSVADVQAIRNALEARLVLLSHKVPALVDYDNFVVAPEVLDAVSDMVLDVASRHYAKAAGTATH